MFIAGRFSAIFLIRPITSLIFSLSKTAPSLAERYYGEKRLTNHELYQNLDKPRFEVSNFKTGCSKAFESGSNNLCQAIKYPDT